MSEGNRDPGERMPYLVERMRRFGTTIFDIARTPYPPIARPDARVALLVESAPTKFIVSHANDADAYGPFEFDCDALGQPHDDCAFVPMNHSDLYVRFAEVWPEVVAFIRTGRFSVAADRTPPADVSLGKVRR